MLSLGNPVMYDANLKDPQKDRLGILAECLEKALLLPEDMQELRLLESVRSSYHLKRDLAKVCNHPLTFVN